MHLTVNPNNKNAIKVYENFGLEVYNISYMMKLYIYLQLKNQVNPTNKWEL